MINIFYSVGGPTRTAKIAVFFDNLTRFRQNRAVDSKRGICVCPKPIHVSAMNDIIINTLLAIECHCSRAFGRVSRKRFAVLP